MGAQTDAAAMENEVPQEGGPRATVRPGSPLPRRTPKEPNVGTGTDACELWFGAASTTAKTQKQAQYSLTDGKRNLHAWNSIQL